MQAVSVQTGYLNLPSKLEDIEERLQLFHEESALLRLVDNAQDNSRVSGLLEDLQEAVDEYMVRS